MEYFDFIKGDELDDLPEDPQAAFIGFVRIAQPRLTARLREIGPEDQYNYSDIQDARYGFQSVVLGAAKKFGIEPFASIEMPTLHDYSEGNYRQFRADLTHYITQIMLAVADRDRSTSVPLLEDARQSVRTYIAHLRDAIDRTDLPERKKANLHKHLDRLEEELTRRRVRLVVVATAVMAIVSAPGNFASSYDAVVRLTNAIMREIGTAKATDEEQRKISFPEPLALSPPRTEKREEKFERQLLDEELPF
jgi:hypothetical protein